MVDGKDIGKAMAATPFDTLKNAGFTDKQADAIVFAIQTSIKGELLIKSDLTGVATKSAISEFRADMYRALWIQGAGLVMIMVALFTLFRAF